MSSTSQRGARLLKFFKDVLSSKLKNASISKSKSSMILNFKRAIQSTPDLLNSKGAYGNFSSASLVSPTRSPSHRYSFDSSPGSSESSFPLSESSSASSYLKPSNSSDASRSIPTTRVLFSPPKLTNASRTKLPFNFSMKKSKSVSEFQIVTEPLPTVPTIILTSPEDDDSYLLYRPFPPISVEGLLAVPTRSFNFKSIGKSQENTSKKWPHPAGPWLRSSNPEEYRLQPTTKPGWVNGCRLVDGIVLGWDYGKIEALGVLLPPQLPTEEDLQTIALVEQISMNLDRAQEALYADFDSTWETDFDDEDYEFSAAPETWRSQDYMVLHAEMYDPEGVEIIQ